MNRKANKPQSSINFNNKPNKQSFNPLNNIASKVILFLDIISKYIII